MPNFELWHSCRKWAILPYAFTEGSTRFVDITKRFYLLQVFFVLRKKQNQVTFLHVYHHTITALFSWGYLKYLPGTSKHSQILTSTRKFSRVLANSPSDTRELSETQPNSKRLQQTTSASCQIRNYKWNKYRQMRQAEVKAFRPSPVDLFYFAKILRISIKFSRSNYGKYTL